METGSRVGEAWALKVKDLDVKQLKAIIRRTWSRTKLVETTKGRNKPPVYLSDKTYEIAKRNMEGKFGEDFVLPIRSLVADTHRNACGRDGVGTPMQPSRPKRLRDIPAARR